MDIPLSLSLSHPAFPISLFDLKKIVWNEKQKRNITFTEHINILF